MSETQRVQDILLGAIMGIGLGVIGGLWASTFDELFLKNQSDTTLIVLLVVFSLVLLLLGYGLWAAAKRIGETKQQATPSTLKRLI
jgi:hypothetical protein